MTGYDGHFQFLKSVYKKLLHYMGQGVNYLIAKIQFNDCWYFVNLNMVVHHFVASLNVPLMSMEITKKSITPEIAS